MLALYSGLNKTQYGSQIRRKKLNKKTGFFSLKYEPYMDNMDIVSTSQSRYFQKYMNF